MPLQLILPASQIVAGLPTGVQDAMFTTSMTPPGAAGIAYAVYALSQPSNIETRLEAITNTTPPVLGALNDTQTPSSAYTPGVYSPQSGTITGVVPAYTVNGTPRAGSFDLTLGDIVALVSETVTDSAGNSTVFDYNLSSAVSDGATPVVSITSFVQTGALTFTLSEPCTAWWATAPFGTVPSTAQIKAGGGGVLERGTFAAVTGTNTLTLPITSATTDGSRVLYLHVEDAVPNAATTNVAFTRDTVAPTVSITSYNGTTLGLTSNEEGSLRYTWQPTNTPMSAAEIAAASGAALAVTASANSLAVSDSLLSQGTWFLHVSVTDAAGNARVATPWAYNKAGGLTEKQLVEGLRYDLTSNGVTPGTTLRVVGTDPLPAGMTRNATALTVTVGTGFSGEISAWDFTGHVLIVRSAAVTRIINCKFGEFLGVLSNKSAYLDIYASAAVPAIERCTFEGPYTNGGAPIAIKIRSTGEGLAFSPGRNDLITRCRFIGLTSDAFKPVGSSALGGQVISHCYVGSPANLPNAPTVWNASTTYALGFAVIEASTDRIFISKIAGNLNNPLPGGTSKTAENTQWQGVDAHADALTVVAAIGNGVTVENCLFDQAIDPPGAFGPYAADGTNNVFRLSRDSGSSNPVGRITIRKNMHHRASGGEYVSYPIQVANNGLGNWTGPVEFTDNWLSANVSAQYFHPTTNGLVAVWQNNRDLHTDALISSPTLAAPLVFNVGILAQSQSSHWVEGSPTMTSTIPKPTGVPSGVVTVYQQVGASDEVVGAQGPIQIIDVTQTTVDAGLVNPAIAAFAVWINRVRPGRKVNIFDFAEPGTSIQALWNDATTTRSMTNFIAMRDQANALGGLDLLINCWMGSDGAAAKDLGLQTAPFITGQRLNPALPWTLGQANPDAQDLTNPIDHILWDTLAPDDQLGRGLLLKSKTKYMHLGWPTFGAGGTDAAEWQGFTRDNTGGVPSGYADQVAYPARTNLDAWLAEPRFASFGLGQHFSTHMCDMNGTTHPVKTNPYGLVYHGWGFAAAIARAMGLSISTPTVVGTEGPTDGTSVDVLFGLPNGGTLSTPRQIESNLPAPSPVPPHHHIINGFEINRGGVKRPVYRTDAGAGYPDSHKGTVTVINAAETHPTYGRVGRVRITPIQPLAYGQTIDFLNGDASAVLAEPRDVTAKMWASFPMEHVPAFYFPTDTYPMPGVSVRPQAVNLPTYAAAPTFTAQWAHFDGSTSYGAASGFGPVTAGQNGALSVWLRNNQATWNSPTANALDLRIATGTQRLVLRTNTSGRMTLVLSNDGADPSNHSFFAAPGSAPFVVGQAYHILAAWTATGLTIYVNGVLVYTATWTTHTLNGSVLTRIGVGGLAINTARWTGAIGHLWADLNLPVPIDFSVAANREDFALAGVPVNVGPDGSLVNGTVPEMYFDGAGAAWSNRGSAGNVTLTGTLTAATPAPSY